MAETDVIGRMVWWRKRRSAGIAISAPVHRMVRHGDAMRSLGRWAEAAAAYEAAVRRAPELTHIWIQLGHARMETAAFTDAEHCYRRSLAHGGDAGEAWLHVGHSRKRRGDQVGANQAYIEAAGYGNANGLAELTRAVGVLIALDESTVRRAVAALFEGHPQTGDSPAAGDDTLAIHASTTGGPAITYDISDLVAHFRHHRLPTGIQRFQLEILERALDRGDVDTAICCFVEGRGALVGLRTPLFLAVAQLARAGGAIDDERWQLARALLFVALSATPDHCFRRGETLVNLGTSWWIYNYHLLIRDAKTRHGIRFATAVFDLIPVLASWLCVRGIAIDYANWLIGAFDHTDLFLCISESTAADLRRIAAQLGAPLAADAVSVIPLDADFRPADAPRPARTALADFGLEAGTYALCVSTIEARKNHVLALEAWDRLLRRGDVVLPRLVFVGRDGWLNTSFHAKLADNPALRATVTIIETASDNDLAQLYRGCLFTVYPSLYEGWGLPVTESLCYSKVPIVADNSSLPEAGGPFARYFESASIDSLMDAVAQVAGDGAWRSAREAEIAERFKPRTWRAVADQLVEAVARLADRDPLAPPLAIALPGRVHRIARHGSARLWPGLTAGEAFRVGEGWHWPDGEGCRIKAEGATLRCRVAIEEGTSATVFVMLIGMRSSDCAYRLRSGNELVEGTIERDITRWAKPLRATAGAGGTIDISVEGAAVEEIGLVEGGGLKSRRASLGVAAFAVVPDGDADARSRLLQAVATADLAAVDSNREPRRARAAA